MLKIQRMADRGAVVLTVSGRLDAENVGQLCELLDAVPVDTTVALDLRDLLLADRASQLSVVHSNLDGRRGHPMKAIWCLAFRHSQNSAARR